MPDALRVLDRLGVTIGPEQSFPFRGIRFREPGTVVSATFPNGFGLGVRRPVLHQSMIRRAAGAGASLLWGVRVSGICAAGVTVNGQLVRCRWIIGADGQNSQIRRWAGLDAHHHYQHRFAFRRHYRVAPWSDSLEIYWGAGCQFYITPVCPQEVCVVLISRDSSLRMNQALAKFPELMRRLHGDLPSDTEKGAISATCRLKSVVRERVALIGDASGSVDAITGEGMCLAFQQALALADALASGDLGAYDSEHRRLFRRPAFMAGLMLSLDRFPRMRRRALQALAAKPAIFSDLLAAHVGARSPANVVVAGAIPLGWQMLTAG